MRLYLSGELIEAGKGEQHNTLELVPLVFNRAADEINLVLCIFDSVLLQCA
ncbi:hypothetical protein D3C73_1350820 [compost metagenome]